MARIIVSSSGGGGPAASPVTVVAASGATETLNCGGYSAAFDVTEDANCTYTLAGAVSGRECAITLKRRDTAGGHVPTFTGVKWPLDTMPLMTLDAGQWALAQFVCFDGSTWEGALVGIGYEE